MAEISGGSSSQGGQRKRLHQLSPPAWEKVTAEEEEEGTPHGVGPARGRKLWGLLQRGFRRAVEKMKKEEMKTTYLSHGLQHWCRLVLASPVRHVTHDSQRKAFVVLDSANTLHLLTEDGCCRGSVKGPAPMAGVLYVSQVDQFVAWDAGGLQVLDPHFRLLSQVQSLLPIHCSIYSEQLNRIVTAGDGNLTLWDFRYGFRSLQCHASVRTGLGPHDVFVRLALDSSSSEPQRCFASCDAGVATFDIARGGNLLAFKTTLHSREITDLAYCEAIGCVITASRDTTIKVWDKEWHIQIVFVGHTAPVVAVTIYPQRPLIFSASQDGTVRTWNLNTIDQVDQVHVLEPVEALETHTRAHVISISGCTLNLWKINQLYSLYAWLGSPAKRLSCTDLSTIGNFPVRVLCLCQDSTVRLLEAQSGAPLSVLSLDQPSRAQEVAYCLPRETLFVLLEQGHVLRVNTATSPMTVKKSFSSSLWGSRPCCLLLYSHLVDPDKAYTTWLEVTQSQGYRKTWQKGALQGQDRNRFLPILGHKDGSLSILDWFSGRVQYTVEAHSFEPVTALAEYPSQTCVLSAETLAVAFQDPGTVTYSIVHYNLMEQTRSEHGPEDDAQDDITGLCCCPNLKLFASASRDGSVKVWDMRNRLLRHLKLNTIPESLAFANHKGDLLVGLEQHLYLISHSEYLPSYYQMKLLWAKFLEPLQNVSLPISTSNFEALVRENRRRLMQELPSKEAESPMSGSCRMTLKESREVREARAKLEGISQLVARNWDLQLLQEGKITPAKKLRFTRKMREEAFERYLQVFYRKQLSLKIPEEDPFDADEVLEALDQVDPIAALRGPTISSMFLGGFAKPRPPETDSSIFADVSPSLLYPSSAGIPAVLQVKRKKVDIVTTPSSARMPEPPALERAGLPPPHLAQEAPEPLGPLPARAGRRVSLPALRRSVEDAVTSVVLGGPVSPHTGQEPQKYLASASLLKSPQLSIITKGFFPERPTSHQGLMSPAELESQSFQVPRISSGFIPNSVVAQQLYPLDMLREKLMTVIGPQEASERSSRASLIWTFAGEEPPEEEPLLVATDSTSKSGITPMRKEEVPSPKQRSSGIFLTQLDESQYPEPAREVPEFVLPFVGQAWFQKLFPEGFPPKMSLEDFLKTLQESLLSHDVNIKRKVVGIIALLQDQLDSEARSSIQNTLIQVLNEKGNVPSLPERIQQNFSLEALRLLLMLDRESQDAIVQLMVCYLIAPAPRRAVIKDMITGLGLQDPDSYFFKEMDSWPVGTEDPKEVVQQFCSQWLEKAIRIFQEHRIQLWVQGASSGKKPSLQSCHKEQKSRKPLQKSRKEARKPSGGAMKPAKPAPKKRAALPLRREVMDREEDLEEQLGRKDSSEDPQKAKDQASPWQQPVRPVDAIQYFTERQLESKPEEMKELVPFVVDSPQDTVLALPPLQKAQAILRLGETNAMLRTRVPERFYFPYIFPRYLMSGFVPFVKLPLPKINLEPFPSLSRRPASPKTFTATQRLVQKYFIPKFSYADSYP